jgi:hypothetical protein
MFATKDAGRGLGINARRDTTGRLANVFCVHWFGSLIEPQTLLYLPNGAGWESKLHKLPTDCVPKRRQRRVVV